MNNNSISVNTFNKFAQKYQEKYMSLDLYNDTFEPFCNLINQEKPSILELGCGPGNITRHLLNKFPKAAILGTDLAPKMVQLAIENNPSVNFEIMDCRDVGEIESHYDAIMCGFCIPYLSQKEVGSLIADVSKVLKENGVIYFSTMEGDYNNSALQTSSSGDQVYIYYHQGEDLITLLKENGFRIIHVQRKKIINDDDTTTIDLFITAQLR